MRWAGGQWLSCRRATRTRCHPGGLLFVHAAQWSGQKRPACRVRWMSVNVRECSSDYKTPSWRPFVCGRAGGSLLTLNYARGYMYSLSRRMAQRVGLL